MLDEQEREKRKTHTHTHTHTQLFQEAYHTGRATHSNFQ